MLEKVQRGDLIYRADKTFGDVVSFTAHVVVAAGPKQIRHAAEDGWSSDIIHRLKPRRYERLWAATKHAAVEASIAASLEDVPTAKKKVREVALVLFVGTKYPTLAKDSRYDARSLEWALGELRIARSTLVIMRAWLAANPAGGAHG